MILPKSAIPFPHSTICHRPSHLVIYHLKTYTCAHTHDLSLFENSVWNAFCNSLNYRLSHSSAYLKITKNVSYKWIKKEKQPNNLDVKETSKTLSHSLSVPTLQPQVSCYNTVQTGTHLYSGEDGGLPLPNMQCYSFFWNRTKFCSRLQGLLAVGS